MSIPHEERRPGVGTGTAQASIAGDALSLPRLGTMHRAALELLARGMNVIPVCSDGSKRPGITGWQRHRTTPRDLAGWFGGPRPRFTALGIATGQLSGGLEMLEIEGPYADRLAEVYAAAERAGCLELPRRLNGWAERSPSGGWHFLYRVSDLEVPGSTVLARTAEGHVIAETRGTGGQTVVAPSGGGAHPSGRPWERLTGGPGTVPTLSATERERVHALFRLLDNHSAGRAPLPASARRPLAPAPSGGAPRPGDDFNQRATWEAILTPAGWAVHSRAGEVTYWTRPGKHMEDGASATTGYAADADRLYVFSTAAPPFTPRTPYNKFTAYALLHHDGDHSSAARALRAQGYGAAARVQDGR